MPKIDKITVDNTTYDIVSGDNLPVGTEVDIDDNATIPTGWEEDTSYDTGWVNITLNNGITAVKARIKKIGKLVTVNIQGVENWTNGGTFATIPSQFRPTAVDYYQFLTPANGATYIRFEVHATGELKIMCLSSGGPTIGGWASANVSYFID